jgi:hypothetical protein
MTKLLNPRRAGSSVGLLKPKTAMAMPESIFMGKI